MCKWRSRALKGRRRERTGLSVAGPSCWGRKQCLPQLCGALKSVAWGFAEQNRLAERWSGQNLRNMSLGHWILATWPLGWIVWPERV